MYSDIRTQFVGNLTRDPELKTVGEHKVCSFSVAVNTGERKEDGTYDTNYFNCSAWGATAEYLMNKLQKGTQVDVVGDLKLRAYTSEKDGAAKVDARVTVYDIKPRRRIKGAEEKADVDGEK